ncbi:hypothetical protein ESCO_003883 [Escovopsis weberi]|uniref:Uncharacterized protein n=1 Tax=Escovopsis weberi TaxID=150374 RepID=A0A0N0RU66_ESCWE|nr:hypothetical protein ESCO_003883 [Escovopsis weberi]
MAIWPFRFKSSTKGSAGATADDLPPPPPPPPLPPAAKEATLKRAASKRKQALPPPEDASIRTPRSFTFTAHAPGPTCAGRKKQDGATKAITQAPPLADLVPTLHHKRTDSDLTGRKSAQRAREELDREAEIKAMSSFPFMTVRAVTYSDASDAAPKQIHRRVRTEGPEPPWRYPVSEASPVQSPPGSSLSLESELASYQISALDALAPRPTLRCVPPRMLPSRSSAPVRRPSQKKRTLVAREPISEETLKAHKRIDDLADDLDASDLRELLERDARRRERQRQNERDKTERKLARRAERQRLREAEARMSGAPLPKNLERGSW